MTDDEFFSATDQLKCIHQWARARYAARKAVLGSVMLRASASTEAGLRLPGVIGGPASLNLGVVFVSRSGGGKGISDKVGALAWPADIVERPIGSGEGIAALFMPPKKDGVKPVTRALLSVPEIDTLAGVAARQGSILLAQLKSALMGELIGQSNASDATTRIVQAHTYRCGLSIGAQPGHTGVIFNDTTGGTPQRLLWLPTTDPDMPAEPMADPPPLDTKLPPWAQNGGVMVYGPSEIEQTIISAHLARQRGEGDALDGHALLTRCKVAAVLAIMHHQSVVDDLFWELSDTVMEWSNATRDWILAEAKRAERAKVRDRAISRAYGEEAVDDRRAEVVMRRVKKILTDGPATYGEINRRVGKREYRELLGQALDSLLRVGEIFDEKLPKGIRYTLTQEFNVEPGFNPQNPSSNWLTPEFNVEPEANSTDHHSASSSGSEQPKLSCPKWLAQHVADLQNTGHTTTTSLAVHSVGKARGYSAASITNAIKANAVITEAGRNGTTITYSITGEATDYTPLSAWVHSYLDALPVDTAAVDKDAFKQAAETAGHNWEAAAKSLRNSGRIEAVQAAGDDARKTIWRITRDGEASA